MAAIAYPMPDPWVTPRPRHPGRTGPAEGLEGLEHPGARVLRPARPVLPEPRVYRRRRAVALLALVIVVFVAMAALRLTLAGPGGGALTTSGSSGIAAPPAAAAAGQVYVVQPGDTLWSIVQTTGRHGDPRPEVDRLALQLDGRPLQPGQRLHLP